MPAISKITAKGQTTVPQEVRNALKSKPGDLIAWEIEPNGRVAEGSGASSRKIRRPRKGRCSV